MNQSRMRETTTCHHNCFPPKIVFLRAAFYRIFAGSHVKLYIRSLVQLQVRTLSLKLDSKCGDG